MNIDNKTFDPLPKLHLDKKRFRVKYCPCGKSNKDGKFVPYIGYENEGYCHGCGETFLPLLKRKVESCKYSNTAINYKDHCIAQLHTIKNAVSFIPVITFKESLKHHKENNFIKYLITLFGTEIANQLIGKYFIGTSKHWSGATVFWQIDIAGNIKTGKIMLYNAETGKRSKEQRHTPNWAHNVLKLPEFALQQCFFGEHLLQGNNMPVAIVESEKTAIIASVYLPKFIWLAAGNKTGLADKKCKALQGRKVILYPDLNAFELWTLKAKEFSYITRFTISGLLEWKATEQEKSQGFDLADYLIKFPAKAYEPQPEKVLSKVDESSKTEQTEKAKEQVILINERVRILTETHTGKEFDNMILVYLKSDSDKGYDLLFDKNQIIIPQENEAVKRLSYFFNKSFVKGLILNEPCLINALN